MPFFDWYKWDVGNSMSTIRPTPRSRRNDGLPNSPGRQSTSERDAECRRSVAGHTDYFRHQRYPHAGGSQHRRNQHLAEVSVSITDSSQKENPSIGFVSQ